MVTSNIVQRVLRIKTRDSEGACFMVDVDGRQYLVTARHLVGDPGARLVNLYHERQWKALRGEWIGLGAGDIDIAVFAPTNPVGTFGHAEPTAKDMVYGRDPVPPS